MKTLTFLSLMLATRAALACSQPPPWDYDGFGIYNALWHATATVSHGDYLVLQNPAFDVPDFARVAAALEVEVLDAAGQVLEGTLQPSPLQGTVLWVPTTPLTGEGPWLMTSVVAPHDTEQRTEFTLVPEAPQGAARLEVQATKAEHTVLGECIVEAEDFCGFSCAEHEELRTEMRFGFQVEVGFSQRSSEPSVLRTAVGTTPGEARAIRTRTPFQLAQPELEVAGSAYPTWPSDAACLAVEVRSLTGEVQLDEVRCVPLVPDETLSRDIRARLEEPPTAQPPAAGGCQSAPGGRPGAALLGLLVGLALRRGHRRPAR